MDLPVLQYHVCHMQLCSLVGLVALFGHYEYGKVDTCMPVLMLMLVDYAMRWWLIARSGEAHVEAVELIQMPDGVGARNWLILVRFLSFSRLSIHTGSGTNACMHVGRAQGTCSGSRSLTHVSRCRSRASTALSGWHSSATGSGTPSVSPPRHSMQPTRRPQMAVRVGTAS